MLKKVWSTGVTIVTMVEHPGGHDGGEFPQEESFEAFNDGTAYYTTNSPKCGSDAFSDEDPEGFVNFRDRESVAEFLESEAGKLGLFIVSGPTVKHVAELFKTPGELRILYNGFPCGWDDEDRFCYLKDGEIWWTGTYWGGEEVEKPKSVPDYEGL